jgi:peptide/nickel transport system substrate-binding protein
MARFRLIVAAAASLGFIAGAQAQELKIGLSAEPSAMDPHFHNLTPNHSATKHIFDRLLDQDEN